MLTAAAMGQGAPAPALRTGFTGDIAASYEFAVKQQDYATGLQGADLSTTAFLTKRFGLREEVNYQQIDHFKMTEYGMRAGVVYQFKPSENVQPYAEFLGGYARTRSNWLQSTVYQSGLSLLGGGGADMRMRGRLFLRTAADIVFDGTNHWQVLGAQTGGHNYFGRVLVGIAFHPSDYGSGRGR
jgi:hypothetical protein